MKKLLLVIIAHLLEEHKSLYEYLKLINKGKKFKIYLLTPDSDNELLKI